MNRLLKVDSAGDFELDFGGNNGERVPLSLWGGLMKALRLRPKGDLYSFA